MKSLFKGNKMKIQGVLKPRNGLVALVKFMRGAGFHTKPHKTKRQQDKMQFSKALKRAFLTSQVNKALFQWCQ
jgi:hypothetical protein